MYKEKNIVIIKLIMYSKAIEANPKNIKKIVKKLHSGHTVAKDGLGSTEMNEPIGIHWCWVP